MALELPLVRAQADRPEACRYGIRVRAGMNNGCGNKVVWRGPDQASHTYALVTPPDRDLPACRTGNGGGLEREEGEQIGPD